MHKGVNLEALMASAEAGDLNAQYEIGRMSRLGPRSEIKEKRAQKWFLKAARQGHVLAKRYLVENDLYKLSGYEEFQKWTLELAENGNLKAQYELGRDKGLETATRIRWLWKAVDQQHVPAMLELAYLLETSRDGERDEKKAAELYRKVAEMGDVGAQASLGIMYADGRGVPQDDTKAVKWLSRPIEMGMGNAWVALGKIHEKKGTHEGFREAKNCYQKPEDGYRSYGKYHLGRMHENGLGVPRDHEKALICYMDALKSRMPFDDPEILFGYVVSAIIVRNADCLKRCRESAENGNARAQVEYGASILNQIGAFTNEDKETALWFKQAAMQGDALGQYCWGRMIELKYAPGGPKEATKWFRMAAKNGVADAQEALGRHYAQKSDYQEAAKWYRLAAEQGHSLAQYELGKMYAEGRGVAKDLSEAAKWCRLAFEWTCLGWMRKIRALYSQEWEHAQL